MFSLFLVSKATARSLEVWTSFLTLRRILVLKLLVLEVASVGRSTVELFVA